jgi:uncharacterized protein with FMN-binding domain
MKASPGLAVTAAAAGFAGVLALHIMAVPGVPAQTGSVTPAAPASPATRSGAARPAHHGAVRPPEAGDPLRTAMGVSVQFPYGTLAVRVTVRGSRITNITVASLQTLEPTSQMISEQAIPVLRSEVLAAQNANVQGVSGASYTSSAYVQSVQAALDALHIS